VVGSKDPSRPAGCVGEGGRSAGWRRRQRWVGGSAVPSPHSIPHYLALRALETPRDGQIDLRVLQEWTVQMNMLRRGVRRTGQNVNQIARLLNGGGGVGRQAEETLAAATAALRKLDPLVEWMTHASGMGQA